MIYDAYGNPMRRAIGFMRGIEREIATTCDLVAGNSIDAKEDQSMEELCGPLGGGDDGA